jgi:hypothetical protein
MEKKCFTHGRLSSRSRWANAKEWLGEGIVGAIRFPSQNSIGRTLAWLISHHSKQIPRPCEYTFLKLESF